MQQESRSQDIEESPAEPYCFLVCRDAVIEEEDYEYGRLDESLHRLVHHFIPTETLGTKPDVAPLVSPKDKKVLDFAEASYRNESNVCTIGLPWIDPDVVLPDNKNAVLRYFYKHEKRLIKEPDYAS